MKIIRNGQEIELTSLELAQAYEEQHREYFGMDVCDELRECYDIDPNRGDIDDDTTDEDLEYYCEDKIFADLMERFLDLMTAAKRSGGLYEDRIVSKYEED